MKRKKLGASTDTMAKENRMTMNTIVFKMEAVVKPIIVLRTHRPQSKSIEYHEVRGNIQTLN